MAENWEQETIKELARNALTEQRKARRWGVFFKVLTFAYLGLLLFLALYKMPVDGDIKKDHTALVKLDGVISAEEVNFRDMNKVLKKAFEADHVKGVVLEINSPGGSPVQSEAIYNKIRALREEHPETKLYAVITDVGASGAYYIAAAADEIYAARASIVGSIGVRMDSFGVTDLMDKIGVESRSITAGKNKALMSPFLPENPEHRAHLEKLLGQVHQQFIGDVRAGRGDRLKEFDGIFSGLFWTGEEAVKLGLIDGISTSASIAKDKIGEEHMISYTHEENLLDKLTKKMGKVMVDSLADKLLESGVEKPVIH